MTLYTRETSASGGISLTLRGSGAVGAAFEAPSTPIWETATFGGGKGIIIHLGRREGPTWSGDLRRLRQ